MEEFADDEWQGYRLTTAEIFYYTPEDGDQVQSYVWQEFDCPATYPRLHEFIKFWLTQVEGKLHSVKVAIGGPLIESINNKNFTVFSVH
jgi:uncharacterized protein Usg